MEISGTQGISALTKLGGASQAAEGQGGGAGFGELLETLVGNLESTSGQADAAVQGLALGQDVDLHDVIIATEMEALSFQLALQVRNRAVETVNTVFNMQV